MLRDILFAPISRSPSTTSSVPVPVATVTIAAILLLIAASVLAVVMAVLVLSDLLGWLLALTSSRPLGELEQNIRIGCLLMLRLALSHGSEDSLDLRVKTRLGKGRLGSRGGTIWILSLVLVVSCVRILLSDGGGLRCEEGGMLLGLLTGGGFLLLTLVVLAGLVGVVALPPLLHTRMVVFDPSGRLVRNS
jgi:hypothetical protein